MDHSFSLLLFCLLLVSLVIVWRMYISSKGTTKQLGKAHMYYSSVCVLKEGWVPAVDPDVTTRIFWQGIDIRFNSNQHLYYLPVYRFIKQLQK